MMGPIKLLNVAGYNVNLMKTLATLEDNAFYLLSYNWPIKHLAHKLIVGGLHALDFKLPENAVSMEPGCVKEVGPFIKKQGCKKALIMTDSTLSKIGLVKKLTDSLDAAGVGYAIYDEVVPDPTIMNVESGYKLFKEQGCDIIIGFGGGSSIDAAKVVGARVIRPDRMTDSMGGALGVTLPNITWLFKKPEGYPKVICIPTTSGTGAETTFAAVITNPKAGRKYTVNDLLIQPDYSFVDPELTIGVPGQMTALTAIDALSHCVESYVGDGYTKESDKRTIEGVKLIFDNLDKAVKNPEDIEARTALARAAHMAGQILVTGFTTYVHPFAHKGGAMLHMTHGFLIGTFMPHILELYRPEADERLAELAEVIGVAKAGASTADNAEAFIQAIRDLCAPYGIDGKLPQLAMLDKKDYIKAVRTEAFVYPVPRYLSDEEMSDLLDRVSGIK